VNRVGLQVEQHHTSLAVVVARLVNGLEARYGSSYQQIGVSGRPAQRYGDRAAVLWSGPEGAGVDKHQQLASPAAMLIMRSLMSPYSVKLAARLHFSFGLPGP